ncbi:MAG: FAD-binding oxidoreductase [Clostridia bacterium]|nr:FAD-binding oxidoreductase [Clostridia bacterium]
MNITQGNIFWEQGMDIRYNYPYLTHDRKCDILIIGGGITGALSAYYQAKQGHNVILVEKNLIGYGSTLENMGVICANTEILNNSKKVDKKTLKRVKMLSSKALKDIVQIIEEINNTKEENKEIPYSLCDTLYFSDRASGKFVISKLHDEIYENDSKIEYIEENDLLDISAGVLEKESSLLLNPYIFNQELVQYLSKMENVEVYENTYIEVLNSKDNEVEAQTSNRFKIHAKKAIVCAGISIEDYLKDCEFDLYKTFNIAVKLDKSYNTNLVALDNVKMFRFNNNHVILNGEDIKITKTGNTEEYEKRFADGKYKRLYNTLIRSMEIEDIKIKNCFYGTYLMTKDGLPIIDEIEQLPNIYCNLGIGKNGIIYSAIGAKMLSSIYDDCYTKDMNLFRINR